MAKASKNTKNNNKKKRVRSPREQKSTSIPNTKKGDFNNTNPPTVHALRQAIKSGLAFKGKDASRNPLVLFFLAKNESLAEGWLRDALLPPDHVKKQSRLTQDERRLLGYLGTTMCCIKGTKWERELGFAFGASEFVVRDQKNEFFSTTVWPNVDATTAGTKQSTSNPDEKLLTTTSKRRKRRKKNRGNTPYALPLMETATGSNESRLVSSSGSESSNTPPLGVVDHTASLKSSIGMSPPQQDVQSRFDVFSSPELRPQSLDHRFQSPPREGTYKSESLASPARTLGERFLELVRGTPSNRNVIETQDEISGWRTRVAYSATKTYTRARTMVAAPLVMAGTLLQTFYHASETPKKSVANGEEQSSSSNSSPTLDDAVNTIYANTINCNELTEEVLGLAIDILNASRIEKCHDKSDILRVKYRTPSNKMLQEKIFVEVPKPRKSGKEVTEASKRKLLAKRATLLRSFIEAQCGKDELQQQEAVLTYLVEQKMKGTLDWNEYLLDVEDCVAVREIAGGGSISTNVLVTILTAISKLLHRPKLIPTRLKKKIGDLERLLPSVAFASVKVEVQKDKEGDRIFYWVKNQPLVFEMLVTSTILDGKQETSCNISKFHDTHIFVRGVDKGGEDVIDMARYGNREGGNSGAYCMPLSVLEGSSEVHRNLLKTTFSEERSRVVEPLHLQKLQMFEMHFKDESNADLVNDVCCMMVEFVSGAADFHPKLLSVAVDCEDDHIITTADELAFWESGASKSSVRETVDTIELADNMLERSGDSFNTKVTLRLVGQMSTDTMDERSGSYIGCELHWRDGLNSQRIHAFMFASPISRNFESNIVTSNCKKAMSINCDDGKLQMAACGVGTCGDTYNCERCLRRFNDDSYPGWYHEMCPETVTEEDCTDFPLREGLNSLENSYQRHIDRHGENGELRVAQKMKPEDIEYCYSVTDKPLRSNNIDFTNGGPMHIHMGLTTHLTQETVKKLRDLSDDTNWSTSHKKEFTEKAEILKARKALPEYKDAKSKLDYLKREQKKLERKREAARTAGLVEQEMEAQLEIVEMKQTIEDHSVDSGFGLLNREIKGAEEFVKLMQNGEDGKRLDKLDQAEFVFRRAVTTLVGSFNKQHGSMELTARRSMMAVQRREEIYNLTVQVYPDMPTKQAKVIEIMNWWKQQAEELFELGKLMESQKKVTDERLQRMKRHISNFGVSWRANIGYKNAVFWKLHALECMLVNFASTTGMIGRISEQGFENKHFVMRNLKAMLSPMVQTEMRVQKLLQRQSMHFLPGIARRVQHIEAQKKRTGRRGPYNNGATATRSMEDCPSLDQSGDQDVVKEFFDLEDGSGGILPVEFQETYLYYKHQNMPDAWADPFVASDSLGNKAKRGAKFTT